MNIQVVNRTGWSLSCPFCGKDINYTIINNQNPPVPFFYASDSNDVLLKKKHQTIVNNEYININTYSHNIYELKNLWLRLLEDAPPTLQGGKYSLWANVKCPNCFTEIPYNNGVKNLEMRIYEPRIILVDGAAVIGDSESESWRVNIIFA